MPPRWPACAVASIRLCSHYATPCCPEHLLSTMPGALAMEQADVGRTLRCAVCRCHIKWLLVSVRGAQLRPYSRPPMSSTIQSSASTSAAPVRALQATTAHGCVVIAAKSRACSATHGKTHAPQSRCVYTHSWTSMTHTATDTQTHKVPGLGRTLTVRMASRGSAPGTSCLLASTSSDAPTSRCAYDTPPTQHGRH